VKRRAVISFDAQPCIVTRKQGFSKSEARRALKHSLIGAKAIYRCRYCKLWHLTRTPQ
jgi:hypothetical protein